MGGSRQVSWANRRGARALRHFRQSKSQDARNGRCPARPHRTPAGPIAGLVLTGTQDENRKLEFALSSSLDFRVFCEPVPLTCEHHLQARFAAG